MTKAQIKLLRDLDTALAHWLRSYAPEQCDSRRVAQTADFLLAQGGTLYYVAELSQRIKAALSKRRRKR